MKRTFEFFFAAVLLLSTHAAGAATSGSAIPVFLPAQLADGQGTPPQLAGKATVPVRLNMADLRSAAPGQMLDVLLPDSSHVAVRLDRQDSLLPGGTTWTGSVPGAMESLFLLSVTHEAAALYFTISGKQQAQLFDVGGGVHLMFQPDPTPRMSCPIVRTTGPAAASVVNASPAPATPPSDGPFGPSPMVSGPATMDILVLVTPQTVSAVGGFNAAVSYASNDVSYTNTCYNNSETNCQMRLIAVQQANIDESGTMGDILSRLAQDSTVAAIRDNYNADLVSLLVSHGQDIGNNTSIEGIAYEMLSYNLDDSSPGYSVFHYTDSRTFAHETGHNLGGGHYPGDEYPNDPGKDQGVFSYSYAHHFDSACQFFYTVMAYNHHGSCLEPLEIQDPMDYYSNPDKSYYQSPLIGGALGTSDHNNTATFRITAPHVAGWRSVTSAAYVDWQYGGPQNGSQGAPFTKVSAGVDAVNAGGTVYGRAGNYSETYPYTINKAVTIGSWGNAGMVQIGTP